jgi:hypothetical protein
LRTETPFANPKTALRTMITIVRNRGQFEEELAAFYTAGYVSNKFWK